MEKNNQQNDYSDKYIDSLKILTPREIEVLEIVAEGKQVLKLHNNYT